MAIQERQQIKTLIENLHSFEGKMAEKITHFSGSMPFVYIHTLWFGFWIAANHGMMQPLIVPFDPFPYGLLTMIVSLEAIFLSTFIMVAQNRQEVIDTVRDLEEDIEEKEDDKEFADIQTDLDDIKRVMTALQKKMNGQKAKRNRR
jgi:uncharacterized membrane protein